LEELHRLAARTGQRLHPGSKRSQRNRQANGFQALEFEARDSLGKGDAVAAARSISRASRAA
jgi:hypothetical protein